MQIHVIHVPTSGRPFSFFCDSDAVCIPVFDEINVILNQIIFERCVAQLMCSEVTFVTWFLENQKKKYSCIALF